MDVIDWLMDSDPAIRWQVMRDLSDAPRPEPDERMGEALEIVESKRNADGRWPLDHRYHERLLVDFGDVEGWPSRWITLRGARVLRWAGRPDF